MDRVSTDIGAQQPDATRVLARKRLGLLVLLAAPVLAVLDAFVVVIALPSIQRQLHTTIAGAQLVVAGYLVAYAAVLITGGRLGDIHGRRRLLVAGLALFTASSLLAAIAPRQEALIAARVLQGAAAAAMYPQTLALIRIHYRGRELGWAMGAFGLALGLASVTAQLLGGLLLQLDVLGLGWRSIFLINLPIGAAAMPLAVRWIPEPAGDAGSTIDVAGVLLLTAALGGLVYPLLAGRELGWPSWTWPTLAAAVAAGLAFIGHERRLGDQAGAGAPLLNLDLFRIKTFAIGIATTLALYAGQFSFWVLLTWHLQSGLGLTPLTTGLVFATVAAGFVLGALASPPLLDHTQGRVLTLGASTLALATAALGLVAGAGVAPMLPALFACGLGFGLVIPALATIVLRAVPPGQAGAASGLLVTTQQTAGAIGIAISGILYFPLLGRPPAAQGAFRIALLFNVALFAITAALVQPLRRSR